MISYLLKRESKKLSKVIPFSRAFFNNIGSDGTFDLVIVDDSSLGL